MIPDSFYSVDDVENVLMSKTDLHDSQIQEVLQALREGERMSYDLRIKVKVDCTDIYAEIERPKYSEPTYSLGTMFRVCMDWDFEQGEIYNCKFAIDKIQHGIRQIRTNRKAYKKFESPHGLGNIDNAIEVLQSLRDCIYEQVEYIPIQHLYMSW